MVTVYNPSGREAEIRLFDGSMCVFLDNACKDVSEGVAKQALEEHPHLQIIGGAAILDEEASPEVVAQKIEAEIDGVATPDVVFVEQPSGKLAPFSKKDLEIIGLDQAEQYFYCSYPGCQLKFDGPAIMREHLARHDKKDRIAIAKKVEEKEKGNNDETYGKGQESEEGDEKAVKKDGFEGEEVVLI